LLVSVAVGGGGAGELENVGVLEWWERGGEMREGRRGRGVV